jgi:hypothetical protein
MSECERFKEGSYAGLCKVCSDKQKVNETWIGNYLWGNGGGLIYIAVPGIASETDKFHEKY